MTRKEDREQVMSDEERVAAWKARGEMCRYCHRMRPVETITDRLFGCCQQCAEWDNKALVVKASLPCICCGTELSPSCGNVEITVNTVDGQSLHNGMAGGIDCGYGSSHDTNVYMIAVCDACITQKVKENRLTFVYSYMPNADGTPKTC